MIMEKNHRDGDRLHALERWIAEAFEQVSADRAAATHRSACRDETTRRPPSASPDPDDHVATSNAVDHFLDRAEAWLHGRPDALDLIERLRDRVAVQASSFDGFGQETTESPGDSDRGPVPTPAADPPEPPEGER